MKLSFWTLGTPGWSNEAVVDAAKRFGYEGVDLRCAANGNISLQSGAEDIVALRELFTSRDIEIASLLGYNQRGNDDGVDWDAVTADLVAHAALCVRLETPNLRVNVGSPARDSSWKAYLEGFAAAVKQALSMVDGVVMNVQNHPGSITAVQAGELAALVNSERFGIGFSPDHCVDMGEDPVTLASQLAPWVRQVHLADRESSGGTTVGGKLRACLPGEGFVRNREVLETLRAAGFDGWVSFKWEKPTYPDLPDAEVALPRFVAFMSALQVAR
jgi:sugar phosphate isomerase/epimerase